jgi:formamidopyrimidine-DNA glycosylase
MPELAEVDWYRRQWNPGLGARILEVTVHHRVRLFRTLDVEEFVQALTGATLVSSESHGKQMVFRTGTNHWLGIHLGMTGELNVEPAWFEPGAHDHLALHQQERTLVFADSRQFGRVRFHHGATPPDWWSNLPPSITSPEFTPHHMRAFLRRHARAPVKAVLLSQECFPGIGNWMADEALWRAGIHPRRRSGLLTATQSNDLHRALRYVCAGALRIMAGEYRDPPRSWLFRHRWEPGGLCPRHRVTLKRATVGGITTAWCAECQ